MPEKYDKIILISDIHYGIHASNIEWKENIDSYFTNFFFPLLKRENTGKTCVIILGDYFDNRQSLNIDVMISAINTISEMTKIVPVYMIVGNHDLYQKSGLEKHSLICLKRIPNLVIVDSDTPYVINTENDKKITLISWIGDHVNETAVINKYKKNSDILLMHAELCGMSYDNGREIAEGAIVKLGKNCKLYAGHIHKRQVSKSGAMTYVGSPYHLTRSDIGNTKGVYILEDHDDGLVERFVENTFSPKYVKVYMSVDKNGNWEIDSDHSIFVNNYVSIELSEETSNIINSGKITEEIIDKYHSKEIKFYPIHKEIIVDSDVVNTEGNNDVICVFEKTVNTLEMSDDDIAKLKSVNDKYIVKAREELGIHSI
jgi:DNA repair exonuclease SbcCD nuclease subunit